MTASLVRFAAFSLVMSAMVACARATSGVPLYAEYSLDPSRHPEGVDCFYECLASTHEPFRNACFSRCAGVVAVTTASPCAAGSPLLCRSYELEEEAHCEDEDDASETASFLVEAFGAVLEAAVDADDDDDDEPRSRSRAEPKSSSRASHKKTFSKARSATGETKSVVGSKARHELRRGGARR